MGDLDPDPPPLISASSGQVLDPAHLLAHIESLASLLLDADPALVRASLAADPVTIDRCRRFAGEGGSAVAQVVRERGEGEKENEPSVTPTTSLMPAVTYHLHLDVTLPPNHTGSILLIKRQPLASLLPSLPLSSQLQVLNVPEGGSAYETLWAYVHNAVGPLFEAYVGGKGVDKDGKSEVLGWEGLWSNSRPGVAELKSILFVLLTRLQDGDKALTANAYFSTLGIPAAKKKIAELELSLLNLQQNVDIPDVSLTIHPAVSRAVTACREASKRPVVDALGSDLTNDSGFLNRVQADVNLWVKEIQKVTKLDRDPASGTASQEINFWLGMERAITAIEDRLKSDEAVLTLEVLRHAKRFHATVSFLADTGLKDAGERVQKYNQLMKDFPLGELLSAPDVDRIREAVKLIFQHLGRKLRASPYPIRRALALVEAISRDLADQMLRVLTPRRLMYIPYSEFDRATAGCEGVFVTWEDEVKDFLPTARDLIRKRGEKPMPMKIVPAHAKLHERVKYVRQFRRGHEQLLETIQRVMGGEEDKKVSSLAGTVGGESLVGGSISGSTALEDVAQAYEIVKRVDVLDVSPDGTEIWVAAENAYNERIGQVENQIISQLRDRLGSCRNATEMFRVLGKFNALFVRPKIRGAIQEYQSQLIDNVKEDIRNLHDKFKRRYENSEAALVSRLRDIPDVSGTIVWIRQIELQLAAYMSRVESVLGNRWQEYAEGQKLAAEWRAFKSRLETKPLFEAWLKAIQDRGSKQNNPVFAIVKTRSQLPGTVGRPASPTKDVFGVGSASVGSPVLHLTVNFDNQLIQLFKEIRNLLWLGYTIPYSVTNLGKEVRRVYPFSVAIRETVRTYTKVCEDVVRHNSGSVEPLVATHKRDVQSALARMMPYRWDIFVNSSLERDQGGRHVQAVRELAALVTMLQDKANLAMEIDELIGQAVDELVRCEFSREVMGEIINGIQKLIDKLNFEAYSNLESWVKSLDMKVEDILSSRLELALKNWTTEFASQTDSDMYREVTNAPSHIRRRTPRTSSDSLRIPATDRPRISTQILEVRMKNQNMFLDPPLEHARENIYHQLHAWLATVCTLTRIQSSRYDMMAKTAAEVSYASLLLNLPKGTLERAYDVIEEKLCSVSAYVAIWLQYQSLWDLEAEKVYSHIGDDLSKWEQVVHEIRKARATFDNSETEQSFGTIIIDYAQVQSKVNARYDQWQRDVLNRFGSKLGQSMRDFYAVISKSRNELEQHSALESQTTSEAVTFITLLQDLRKKLPRWIREMETFKNGQKTLERQRFQFPNDWLHSDQVDGEWSAFNEILARKNYSIQDQISGLQVKIISEDKAIDHKVTMILSEWEKGKPVQGNMRPDTALNNLSVFEGRLVRLKDEYDHVCRAKEALDLDLVINDRVAPVLEEVRDLKAVWSELSKVWASINELRDTAWNAVAPRKLRTQLEGLVTQTKEMPSKMRQYAAFEYIQDHLRSLMKVNQLLGELKSEALRERHWKVLLRNLKIEGRFNLPDMTLGHLWDFDLKRNESSIRDVIIVAQGEMALEEFLKQVKEVWSQYSLELVNYQNKCRLIRGWDELFAKCSENLSSLAAMKHSPYYKVFEDDAAGWEEKLNRVHVLFDVWIDVQRQWVYLEGIFTSSGDIKALLPIETARFQNINTEFMAVMKKVYKSPFVLDVVNITNIQKSMERLADLLSKIQKALGEYLERERSSFPRFYFVGDEDLLEIIGNAKDILRIQKHFKKMFAGISQLLLNEDATVIRGLMSREGETVQFKTEIVVKDCPKINDWLTLVEKEMRITLATLLTEAVAELGALYASLDPQGLLFWIDRYPAQLAILATQILWTQGVDRALHMMEARAVKTVDVLRQPAEKVDNVLTALADAVLTDLAPLTRKKCEHLITELVHQRDVIRHLRSKNTGSPKSFSWLTHMRYYLNSSNEDPLSRLNIQMANASFEYGFEYLGVTDRLVQTPLTDRCYLTLTQALNSRMGGSPFGPAGTGKTESVKALGVSLGRFVLVFCCDETFDFQAMGRIFVGLCRVGAWGCFDEFNRLEERILSAVSQQIQTIQLGLRDGSGEIELVGKNLRVNSNTGIFITMNPGYAGRQNLPDNLKKLFRSIAMTNPDRELIAQVMLFSQGFRSGELLASKVVPFFILCQEQLSPQSHYDFGLRALKSVLVSAGNLKRERLLNLRKKQSEGRTLIEVAEELEEMSQPVVEQQILIQSIRETVAPKLVAEDVPLLQNLVADVFPGIEYVPFELDRLKSEIRKVCIERYLVDGEMWMEKAIQLYQIQIIHHGVMLVGPSGSGKTMAREVLLTALERVEGIEGVAHVINPKAMSKEHLYGSMDVTTREWTDGLFTNILRKIVDNIRGESTRRHWIIFDGDVDPEWVENLNSVLDDNKLLTLPNGERLNLPPNVRILFEVDTLRYATLATVSRCGMVWFSDEVVSLQMLFTNYLQQLRDQSLDEPEEEFITPRQSLQSLGSRPIPDNEPSNSSLRTQRLCEDVISPYFAPDALVSKALDYAEELDHIMDFTRTRALSTLFSLLNKAVRSVIDYNTHHMDFPMATDHLESYMTKRLVFALVWSFAGDSNLDDRTRLGDFIRDSTTLDLPSSLMGSSIVDYDVALNSGEWIPWQSRVPQIDIETHNVTSNDVIIPTIDTVRHEEILYSWLSEHKPLILCGPPGSGKTMTLLSALRKLPDMEVVPLNFSSATSPELILKTLDQYCEYRKTPSGPVLSPIAQGRWLVVFCDEINLPAPDKYGTQRVISFLRQLVANNGFWRPSDKTFVRLERIQFVGACNPPTDPGRVPLSHRFLRHAPVVLVDYPGELSLQQIYGTYSRAALKVVPSLRGYSGPLTSAMVEFYLKSQKRFTPDIQAHYVYSPRELTRWIRGIYEALKPLESAPVEALVRIWAHEALRLFQDRLVAPEERSWTDEVVNEVAFKFFPTTNREEALERPILYSNWLSKFYVPVQREQLRDFVKARLRVFYEEELDVPLVLFNDVLEHVLRIDRVFRQMQGHLLLIGVSGSGKTTLSRFVAWMNGLSTFQIKVHNKYTAEDFDEDLRQVLRRAGCKGEKIVFIMDESNVLESSFLERMNTLLANSEIPGLFEGDEYSSLMTQCKEAAQREGLMLDSAEEMYKWFTLQITKNLHVVFTMNPPEGGLATRAATSPALFNRCVLDWFGDWSDQALFQVGTEFTQNLDIDDPKYSTPDGFPVIYKELSLPTTQRLAVINTFVGVHESLREINSKMTKRTGRTNHVTPRHYLDFIKHYERLFREKKDELEEQQRHLNVGLDKLRDTVVKVEELRISLAQKGRELEMKNELANEKLKKMLTDQNEAEQKRIVSLQIQKDLGKQNDVIAARRQYVIDDLAKAEPAVLEAQKSVSNIKKQHLVELRSMGSPPAAVKLALESVCVLLGERVTDWKSVQSILKRDDFIANIINFNTDKLTPSMKKVIKEQYMAEPIYNYETVNRASKACGPLVQWVLAQVNYSEILERVGPLRDEVMRLEDSQRETQFRATHVEEMVQELEASIVQYKDEYASLIAEVQGIKMEMERVKSKVDRSIKLLDNLSSEKERWGETSSSFETQMATIVGDVLLASAFLAYAGYFDQQYREQLLTKWSDLLRKSGLHFKQDISLPDFLSSAEERLTWRSHGLPADDLCTENAVMIKRFNRYPLIIDPSGQATTFLLNEYKGRKVAVTSFLDDSFTKALESALRFGNPLLIQDVENLDPILNPVLNRELRRTGGRTLIRLGNQDIDFSPSFMLFLSTRDPSVNFRPDLSSRVTFVNFTVTRASLQSQCLHEVLKSERPDVDRKRNDLIKLQGEFQLRLRQLEKSLLQALNNSKGNVLDDDHVMTTLETLKQEAAEVSAKVEETDSVMREVESVTDVYTPIASACSSIFFVLEQLSSLHHFYRFSLDFFYEIFDSVIHHNSNIAKISDPMERLQILGRDLFHVTFSHTSTSLLNEDHYVLALLLAQIKVRGTEERYDDQEVDLLLGTTESTVVAPSTSGDLSRVKAMFGDAVSKRVGEYSATPMFQAFPRHILGNEQSWKDFMAHSAPEESVPECWELAKGTANGPIPTAFRKLLIIRALRPDRIRPATVKFIETTFNTNILESQDLNLKALVEESKPIAPLVFASAPGFDASDRVENLAAKIGSKLSSVAMGSAEGYALADAAIAQAIKSGTWVLLKNVHLASQWLGHLEKRLTTIKPNKGFRLFLTTETSPKVPANLLRLSRVLMFEPPPGIKASMQAALGSIPAQRYATGPIEKGRIYFLLAWLHSIIQERLRYIPLGWTKRYEFSDADFESSLATIDSWTELVAQGRSNINPSKIPWEAIRQLMKETIYGGKIDNDFDQATLNAFVDNLFTSQAYDIGFKLVDGQGNNDHGVVVAEGTKPDHFIEWVEALPDQEPPSWLGLPENADKVLSSNKGFAMLTKVRQMRNLLDDDEVAYVPEVPKGIKEDTRVGFVQPVWMRNLQSVCENLLGLLPESLSHLPCYSDSFRDPLFRFFDREFKIGTNLLGSIRKDLGDVRMVCKGNGKQTNHIRGLMLSLTGGDIPSHWKVYKIPKELSLNSFMQDLVSRLDQLNAVAMHCMPQSAGKFAQAVVMSEIITGTPISIGALFMPDAFITATRQAVAQVNRWSLEDLVLDVEWVKRDMAVMPSNEKYVTVPVYLNRDRTDLLFPVSLPVGKEVNKYQMVQRGIAIVAFTAM
ncbi:hypothetical protein HDU93_001788 [Gonapodya sp. JEL0774]|nr:hypothetical protein HDU93_001788 [Gonapodya sp. JEL0774]